jgi:hypothetical protein
MMTVFAVVNLVCSEKIKFCRNSHFYELPEIAVDILFFQVGNTFLGPTQPPVRWVPGVLSLGLKRGRGVTLTTHPHLVPRSRMSRIYTSSPSKRLHGV